MSEDLHTLAAIFSSQINPADVPEDTWPRLVERALRHQVGPLLLYRVDGAGAALPADSRARLATTAQQVAAHHLALDLAQQQVDTALRALDITPIWIKGIVLAHTVYPEPHLRTMSDLDVLIPPERREAALDALFALGYTFHNDPAVLLLGSDDPLAKLWAGHHDHLVGGPAGAVVLELHTRLMGDEALLPADRMPWFFSQTIPYTVDRRSYLTLTPAAHLLYLCAHSQLQHQFNLLRWSYDLHRLIQVSPPDWPTVVEQAAHLRWTAAVERALARCRSYFPTPYPVDLLADLRAVRHPDEDLARLNIYRGPGGRWRKTRERLASLPLGESLRLLARIVFPPPAYMRRRYNIPRDRPLWLAYLARWLDASRDGLAASCHRHRETTDNVEN